MVLVTVRVRPKNGYHGPGKIKTKSVDSSQRLEEILNELKLPKKTTALYVSGKELPLNSSVASHNLEEGEILESCSSPVMSSLLSAVLNDFDEIKSNMAESERTRERIQGLLHLDGSEDELDPWPSWSNSDMKARTICLATMKKVLQRDDRYANKNPPQCNDLESLHQYMQPIWREGGTNRRDGETLQWGNPGHLFKPNTRHGRPSLCWTLLEKKYNKYLEKVVATAESSTIDADDAIEAFVKAEAENRKTWRASWNSNTSPSYTAAAEPVRTNTPAVSRGTTTPRRRQSSTGRRNRTPSSSSRKDPPCHWCGATKAVCMCLEEGCAFLNKPSCDACFHLNHPSSIRDHPKTSLNDSAARRSLVAPRQYCPKYASGPFAVLCALLKATQRSVSGGRQLSLREDELKRLAQPMCRSNLYDRAAGRGARNAFACMESLSDRGLVRKELISEGTDINVEKWSLLHPGEQLAKCCLAFEKSLEELQSRQSSARLAIENACKSGIHDAGATAARYGNVAIVVDTREDAEYAKRLKERCDRDGVTCVKRELPAGDYLFVSNSDTGSSDEELVLPFVIERKSWSDFADSVNGTGKGHQRLDCVSIGRNGCRPCTGQRKCQLCRMKQCGCAKVMFIIEGARCSGRDDRHNCDASKRCRSCQALAERHGPDLVQERLEQVLSRLQGEHACMIHFTRSYNDTIDSLLTIHKLLSQGLAISLAQHQTISNTDGNSSSDIASAIALSLGETSPLSGAVLPATLTYEQYCHNARSSNANIAPVRRKRRVVEWTAPYFVTKILDGTMEAVACDELKGESMQATNGGRSGLTPGMERVRIQQSCVARTTPTCVDHQTASDDVIELTDDDSVVEAPSQDQSVVIVESLGGIIEPDFPKEKSSRKRSRAEAETPLVVDLLDDDTSQDSVQIVDERTSSNSAKSTPRTQRERRVGGTEIMSADNEAHEKRGTGEDLKKSCWSVEKPSSLEHNVNTDETLLIVPGLHEYDDQYYGELNGAWQEVYVQCCGESAQSTVLSTDSQRLRSFAMERLSHVEQNNSHLVTREARLFWILWMQVRLRTSVHISRRSQCADAIRELWQPSPVGHALTSNIQFTPRRSTDSTEAARQETECLVCLQVLTRVGVEALQCGHVFHSTCIQGWFQSKGDRICPVCQHGSVDSQSRRCYPERETQSTSDPVFSETTPHSVLPVNVSREREARLRRFEGIGGSPHAACAPTASSVNPSDCVVEGIIKDPKWACEQCTLENTVTVSHCTACGARNPFVSHDPISTAEDTQHFEMTDSQIWTCELCNSSNNVERDNCHGCGTPNPFKLHDCTSMSPEAVTGSARKAAPTQGLKRKVKCAACGAEGHNRATATAQSCVKYFDPAEVQLRNEKKLRAEEKAQQKRLAAEQLKSRVENEARVGKARMEQIERLLAEERSANEDIEQMRAEHLKKAEREARNAEKRAQRYRR